MDKETSDLLKKRAIEMAIAPEPPKAFSNIMELITFTLGRETYGIESVFVREIYPLKDYTPLPGVPAYILGVINLRGQIVPVVNLKKFFNIPEQGITELNRVIILRETNMEFGILADVVHGTKTIDTDEIKPAPHTITGIGQEYLKGVTRERLMVLNAEKLLSDKSMVVNDELS